MLPTEPQRRQHQELGELVQRIGALASSPARAAAQAKELRALLTQLGGKLTVHLAGEDKVIYPRLIAAADATVAATARTFQEEMGGLVQIFQGFAARWTEAAIRGDGAGFLRDLGALVKALSTRIAREDSVLYPLVDRAASP